jgi:peptidoglycan/LPS O-acetylase OafA/YrhL
MVELFFVLSGFVIYKAYADNINSKNDLYRFQFLRFGRLYPVHLLFLILFLCIEFLKYFAAKHYGIVSPNSIPFGINNVETFIAHLFLAQATGVIDHVGSFNSPSWSISTEFYTYLLFALVILKFYKWHVELILLILICSIFMINVPQLHRFSYLLTCFIGFFLGCVVAIVTSNQKEQLPAHTPLYPIAALVLFLTTKSPHGPFIFAIAALLIYTVSKSEDGTVRKILRNSILKKLGLLSYSIYMSHFFILWVVTQFIRVVLKRPEIIIKGESF